MSQHTCLARDAESLGTCGAASVASPRGADSRGRQMTAPVTVAELRQAYMALMAGQFRTASPGLVTGGCGQETRWSGSTGRVLLVVGCMPGVGTSTVALALASHAEDARLVECATVGSSGLCAATSAEMGTVDGWLQGSRGPLLIERRGDQVSSLSQLPTPAATARPWTVLDCSWDVGVLATDLGWLGHLARTLPEVVLVTRPTVPGMRRLDMALAVLGEERVHVVVVGVDRRRWPKSVEAASSPTVRQLRASGRVLSVASCPALSVGGLSPDPLPDAAMAGIADLFTALKGERP